MRCVSELVAGICIQRIKLLNKYYPPNIIRERESDDAWYTYIRFQKLSSIASRVKFGPSIDQSNVAHNFFIVTRLRGCVQ